MFNGMVPTSVHHELYIYFSILQSQESSKPVYPLLELLNEKHEIYEILVGGLNPSEEY